MKKCVTIILTLALLVTLAACGQSKDAMRTEALTLMDSGEYEQALEVFIELGDYKDAAELAIECQNIIDYNGAMKLMETSKYLEAKAAFEKLDAFRDSVALAKEAERLAKEEEERLAREEAERLAREERLAQIQAIADAEEEYGAKVEFADETDLVVFYIYNIEDAAEDYSEPAEDPHVWPEEWAELELLDQYRGMVWTWAQELESSTALMCFTSDGRLTDVFFENYEGFADEENNEITRRVHELIEESIEFNRNHQEITFEEWANTDMITAGGEPAETTYNIVDGRILLVANHHCPDGYYLTGYNSEEAKQAVLSYWVSLLGADADLDIYERTNQLLYPRISVDISPELYIQRSDTEFPIN